MSATPTRDDLLNAWIELHGDTQALRDRFNLSLSDLRAFASDPEVQRELAAWSDLVERGARLQSLHAQQAAARALEATLAKLTDLTEIRRAATSLARIAKDMIAPARAKRTRTHPAPQLHETASFTAESAMESRAELKLDSIPRPDPAILAIT